MLEEIGAAEFAASHNRGAMTAAYNGALHELPSTVGVADLWREDVP